MKNVRRHSAGGSSNFQSWRRSEAYYRFWKCQLLAETVEELSCHRLVNVIPFSIDFGEGIR
jgi:hypothetical protein